jgi:hypothetical protein
VKRTALAFVQAVGSPQDLRVKTLGFDAAGEQVAVISVRREEVVIGA